MSDLDELDQFLETTPGSDTQPKPQSLHLTEPNFEGGEVREGEETIQVNSFEEDFEKQDVSDAMSDVEIPDQVYYDLLEYADEEGKLPKPLAFSVACGLIPHKKQIEFLLDDHKVVVFIAGRQTGKTTITAIKALYHASQIPGKDVIILSPTLRQSRILFDRLKHYANKPEIYDRIIHKITGEYVLLKNGSRVIPFPVGSSKHGSTIRGASPSMVIFEEGDFIPRDAIMAMLGSLAGGGGKAKIVYISTPGYSEDVFGIELINQEKAGDKDISIHFATTFDNPHHDKFMVDLFRRTQTEAEYQREILAQYVFGDSKLTTYERIKAISRYDPNPVPIKGAKYVMGVDLALSSTGDFTAITLFRVENGPDDSTELHMQYLDLISYSNYRSVVDTILRYANDFNPVAIYIDASTIGKAMAQMLKEKLPNVQLITFTYKTRKELYLNLQALIEHTYDNTEGSNKIYFIKDKRIADHILSLTLNREKGELRFEKTSQKGADDLLDSIALAALYVSRRDSFKAFKFTDPQEKAIKDAIIEEIMRSDAPSVNRMDAITDLLEMDPRRREDVW